MLALLNPETSTLLQKHHAYIGKLNSETPGDSENAFLHCGDGIVLLRCHCLTALVFLLGSTASSLLVVCLALLTSMQQCQESY